MAGPGLILLWPLIQRMIDQVDSDTVYSYTGGLSGAWPVQVGGEDYTITSRYTYSGESIQKATQYVGEHMQNLGLDVEYHQWEGPTYPNVIGELPGAGPVSGDGASVEQSRFGGDPGVIEPVESH